MRARPLDLLEILGKTEKGMMSFWDNQGGAFIVTPAPLDPAKVESRSTEALDAGFRGNDALCRDSWHSVDCKKGIGTIPAC